MIKKFLSSLLLIWIWFLGFSNAEFLTWQNGMYIFDVNEPTTLWNYTFQFDNVWNLSTTLNGDQWNFIFYALNNSPYTLWHSYWWYNWKLYYYSKSSYDNSRTQWFINKWCVWNSYEYCRNWNYNYDLQYVIDNIWNISKVLYGTISLTWWSIWWGNFNSYVCFYDWTYYCASCNHTNSSSSPCLSWLTWNSLDINETTISWLKTINWSRSPFQFIPNPWRPIDSWYAITNSWVIIAFDNMWYNKAICYGWVSAWTWSESYRTLIPWTWYNLFELYNMYNPYNLSLRDWYNYYRDWYYDNPTVSFTWSVFVIDWTFRMPLFWLFAFSDKFVSLFPTDDILEYCDVLLNKDPNAYYTWDYKDEVLWFVIRSWKYSLSWSSWQKYNWPLSMLSGSDREMSYRDFFKSVSNNFANSFGDIPLNIVGVVPKYILMFMFALIFIRMISK